MTRAQTVHRRQLRQVELLAQPHHDALAHVAATRDRGQERRLVDDDQALVPVHDVDLPGHLRLVAQVAVEPHPSQRRVGVRVADGAAAGVHESLLRNIRATST